MWCLPFLFLTFSFWLLFLLTLGCLHAFILLRSFCLLMHSNLTKNIPATIFKKFKYCNTAWLVSFSSCLWGNRQSLEYTSLISPFNIVNSTKNKMCLKLFLVWTVKVELSILWKGHKYTEINYSFFCFLGTSSSPNQLWEISRASLVPALPQPLSQPSLLNILHLSTPSPALERRYWMCPRLTLRLLLQKSPWQMFLYR